MLVGPVVPEKTLERLKEKESIVGLQEARSNGGSAPHIRHNQRILYLCKRTNLKGFDVYFIDPKIWIWIIVFLFTFRKFITNRVSVKFEILQ